MCKGLTAVVCLFAASLNAATATWDSIALPASPTRGQVARYVAAVRTYLSDAASKPGQRPKTTDLQRARDALALVPSQFLDVLITACQKEATPEETSWMPPQPPFLIYQNYVGETLSAAKRSVFALLLLERLICVRDFPADKRHAVFSNWDVLPELVVIAKREPWGREGDRFISRDLMWKLDRGSGWRETSRIWISYLVELDTPSAWDALEYLATQNSVRVRIQTYEVLAEHPAPKIDLNATVRKSWYYYAKNPEGEKYPAAYAPIAARHGIVDALVVLAKCVKDPTLKSARVNHGVTLLLLVAHAFPDAERCADFVLGNARSLIFDNKSRTYSLP